MVEDCNVWFREKNTVVQESSNIKSNISDLDNIENVVVTDSSSYAGEQLDTCSNNIIDLSNIENVIIDDFSHNVTPNMN